LLDSAGVIPANLVDQDDNAALLLAACNCIGQALYYNNQVRMTMQQCSAMTTRYEKQCMFLLLEFVPDTFGFF
jgi:ribosome biogenesis GTPase A